MTAARSQDDRVRARRVAASRPSAAFPLVLAAGVLALACNSYDPDLLPPPVGGANGGRGGAGGMDAAVPDGGGGEAGAQDGGPDGCSSSAVEMCNRIDDDCDGQTDENAEAWCEERILNATAGCVPYANTMRCVLLRCRDGYVNCDGDPANGCEPYCRCNFCADDAGTEDGGVE